MSKNAIVVRVRIDAASDTVNGFTDDGVEGVETGDIGEAVGGACGNFVLSNVSAAKASTIPCPKLSVRSFSIISG